MSKKVIIVLILIIIIFGLNSCTYISDLKVTNNISFGNRISSYNEYTGGVIFEINRGRVFDS